MMTTPSGDGLPSADEAQRLCDEGMNQRRRAVAERQARGFYHFDEAAAAIAKLHGKNEWWELSLRERLFSAARAGSLVARDPGTELSIGAGMPIGISAVVRRVDVTLWLEQEGTGYMWLADAVTISARVHRSSSRTGALDAVINKARSEAVDSTDWQSVWVAFKQLAQKEDRPRPLLGFVDGEGVKYESDKEDEPVKVLTSEAFRKRFTRKAKPAGGQ
jgi:hypothetical protein